MTQWWQKFLGEKEVVWRIMCVFNILKMKYADKLKAMQINEKYFMTKKKFVISWIQLYELHNLWNAVVTKLAFFTFI